MTTPRQVSVERLNVRRSLRRPQGVIGAVLCERQAAADDAPPTSTFADLWEQL